MAKIILAESDHDSRFMLSRILLAAGHHVQSFAEGTEIVNGNVTLPDVFILDQQISTIDGLALSKFLKIKTETRKIPIIMLSAYPEMRKKAKQIGVSAFLPKPFAARELLNVIGRHTSP